MNKSLVSILIHLIGCLAYLCLPVIFAPNFDLSLEFIHSKPFHRDLVYHLFLLGFFYMNYYYFMPKIYFENKKLIYAVIVLAAFIAISFLVEILFMHKPGVIRHFGPEHIGPPPIRNAFGFILSRFFFPFFVIFIFSFTLKIYSRWKEVEQEKTTTELSYLKSQINPHFLFNSLNSIFSLSLEEKAPKTAEAIIKLSHMMRYVLSESQQDFVSIEKEIAYIDNYIELQRLRFGETISINYQKTGNFYNQSIAPLLLIPFIENAFKYGVNPEAFAEIKIELLLENKNLQLNVSNKMARTHVSETEKQGIGISNTKNRLLLLYPAKHALSIKEVNREYFVNLKIDLQ